ncbi:carbohydrate ABC transporter permease [Streptomyces sp. RFCAC02]|uniref:carbohydrate ABC transporter permease n=1 Tax=Streptomyces sp. RFCAC02 TaxID=2499143 RepID=UPI00101EA3C7|nr:carbohydrate ABC transporter permease [Streptomyces sp. RFCAC02]
MTLVLLDPPTAPAPDPVEPPPGAAPGAAPARGALRGLAARAGGHLLLIAVALAAIGPVYWMFLTALRPSGDVLSQSPLPWPLSLENVTHVWDSIPMLRMLLNTLLVSVATAAAQLLIAIPAAYGFARWRFPGRGLLFLMFIGSWMIPFQVTMIPNYVLLSQLGLLGTLAGVVVPNLCAPMAVMMLRQHFQAFPRELLDAATMDGRGSWRALWTVVLPSTRPALASLFILMFISAWNDYLWPALVLQRADSVVQIGIRSFLGAEGNDWGAVMAASGLSCVPVLVIYALLQRQVQDSFVRSGLR